MTDWTGGVWAGDLTGLSLTLSNIGGTGQPDVRDNDALLISGIPTIGYTTGNIGENNHTLDMGFRVASCAITGLSFSNKGSCNNNGSYQDGSDDYITADITVTFSNPPATGTLDLSGDVIAGGGPIAYP